MKTYSVKLLFQFRFENEPENCYRMVEERIILVHARSPESAFKSASALGKRKQYKFTNDEREAGHFDFIGIQDMLELGPECHENEVWYNVKKMKTPMERKDNIIPQRHELAAFKVRTS